MALLESHFGRFEGFPVIEWLAQKADPIDPPMSPVYEFDRISGV